MPRASGKFGGLVGSKIKAMYIAGEDVVALYPDETFASSALGKLDFLVVQDMFMTETAKLADVVLPSAAFAEKDGTFTNQEGRVQPLNSLVKPPGEASSDFDIIRAIGEALSPGFSPARPAEVFEEIKKTVELYSAVEVGESHVAGAAKAVVMKGFKEKKKGAGGAGDADKPFELITGNHLLHSGRFSQRTAVLRNLLTGAVVEISEEDAGALGLSDGDRVTVKGVHYEATLTLATKRGTKRGVAFIGENFDDVPVNRYLKRGEGLQRVSITQA